jgi:hypothetical protein
VLGTGLWLVAVFAVLVAALVVGALAAALILPATAPWRTEEHAFRGAPPPGFDHG